MPTRHRTVIGMIHVAALPGAPASAQPMDEIVATAVAEARLYAECGLNAIAIENMHDRPYLRGAVGPEVIACMTAVGCAIRQAVSLKLGVQILAAANQGALAVAQACGASFVRVENFVFAHIADEGFMPQAEAGPLLRYRRQIGASAVQIMADIKKKHASHALTADVDLAETARAAEFFGADGLIVTGTATGRPVELDDLRQVRQAVQLPVWIGSGATPAGLPDLWEYADGFIVGSHFKRDGLWSNPIDRRRVEEFMAVARRLQAERPT